MDYLNKLISKWMPLDSPRVAVDSHPRLSGIMDTINSTLAHGPQTRLPSEFYDTRGRAIIEQIGVEEWFSGYRESAEYRTVGIGSLVGDIVSRMVSNVEGNGKNGIFETGNQVGGVAEGRSGEKRIKFALSGCHDTTLAAILTSFGAFENEKWPPYTSSIALELFRKTALGSKEPGSQLPASNGGIQVKEATGRFPGFWSSWFGAAKSGPSTTASMTRKTMSELSADERKRFDGYYVRIRYNDRPMTIPGCKLPGNHLDGDQSFCTLVCDACGSISTPTKLITGGFQEHC